MTLTQLLTLFRVYADDRNSDRYTDDTEPTLLLNNAQLAAQAEILRFDEDYFTSCVEHTVEPAADSQYEFTLPTDLLKIIQVERLTNDEPVSANWTTFAKRHETFTEQDLLLTNTIAEVPLVYLRGQKLGVARPTETYTLRIFYVKRLEDLSDGADVSEIPAELHRWLALHAAREALLSEQAPFALESLYHEELSRFPLTVDMRQTQAPRHVFYYGEE